MTGNDPFAVVREVQTLFSLGAVGGLTDGQLLERFVARRDSGADAAFAALVQRHGPMVWGVCRRTLNDPHAAADAFQATFLVLVRKAASVRVDDSLGRWLYGVSRKIANRARVTTARRSAREVGGSETEASFDPDPDSNTDQSDLLAELDQEIERLPERYRAAVVLCDLGGTSHEEAARQLGCAVGTVGSRLSRGRERLRNRLTRRGLVNLAGLVGAGLSAKTAPAAVPMALVSSSIRSALQITAGEAANVSANVLALSKGMEKAMFWTRWKVVTALALVTTVGLTALSFSLAQEPKAPIAEVPMVPPTEDEARASKRIIDKALKTYVEAKSYEDDGEVSIVFINWFGRRTVSRPFLTKFVRPKLYRYEFSEADFFGAPKRFVIWSDAAPEKSKQWWTIDPQVKEDSLMMAIAGGTGISGLSSHTVPQMLMPDVVRSLPLSGFMNYKQVGEEPVENVLCDKIEGQTHQGNPQTVWIDKTTFLVRKIYTTSKISGADIEQTTIYRPRVNVEIAPKEFEFEPSKL